MIDERRKTRDAHILATDEQLVVEAALGAYAAEHPLAQSSEVALRVLRAMRASDADVVIEHVGRCNCGGT